MSLYDRLSEKEKEKYTSEWIKICKLFNNLKEKGVDLKNISIECEVTNYSMCNKYRG